MPFEKYSFLKHNNANKVIDIRYSCLTLMVKVSGFLSAFHCPVHLKLEPITLRFLILIRRIYGNILAVHQETWTKISVLE